jgi:hypothetical protein
MLKLDKTRLNQKNINKVCRPCRLAGNILLDTPLWVMLP